MQAITKNGTIIIGSLDRVTVRGELSGFHIEEGELIPDWVGESEVFWDGSEAVQRDGQDLYLDTEGDEFTLAECAIVEDDFDLYEILHAEGLVDA